MSEDVLAAIMKIYAKNGGTSSSFEADLARFGSLNRLLSRYAKCGETNSRLLVNHCTISFNLFGDHAYKLMEVEVNPENYRRLVSVLIFMQRATTNSQYDKEFLKYLEQTCQ